MSYFYIKQNDTSPSFLITCKDGAGTVVPIVGATVVFNMRAKDSTDMKITRGACEVVDGAAGTARYLWQVGDTDTVGTYEAEFEVTFADGKVETFPNRGYKLVKIEDDLA